MIFRLLFPCVALALFVMAACSTTTPKENKDDPKLPAYKPDSQELHDEIVKQDSIYFAAYNTCDMDKQASMYSENIEFYHDRGGLDTSKQAILDAIKQNICGKVTREIVKGSIEVYPIKDYGAIEMGFHMFHNNQEKDAIPHPSKFIIFWHHVNNQWFISRVVSLH